MQILIHIHPELLGCADQGLKRIPSPYPLLSARLQAHIPFADSLPSSQLGRIVMQENFGMGKDHQQVVFLGQSQRFPLVQLVVVTALPEDPLKLTLQIVGLLLVWMLSVDQQLAVQLPELLLEFIKAFAMVRQAWGQLLVVAIFMHPAES